MRSVVFFLFFLPISLVGQTVCSLESRQKLDAKLEKLSQQDHSEESIQYLIVEVGKSFLGTPYVEKTLELPGEEKLVINLTGLDCTTYLETVITLARIAREGQLAYESYEEELEKLRYRNGTRTGYSSRLHYFTDWIHQNQQKGILVDITAEIGGTTYPNQPTFMSENPKFYPQLSDPDLIKAIQTNEIEIAKRAYYYIAKAEIEAHEQGIESGDLIAITTTLKNLDVVHVGFAVEVNGRIHLMHASSASGKVEISEKPLSEYLKANKSQSGIMVCRLIAPFSSAELTMENAAKPLMRDAAQRLQNLLEKGLEYLRCTDEEILCRKISLDKWSKKEILGHLIDSGINNLQRFTEIQYEAKPYQIRKYRQDELVRANNYQQADIEELSNFWKSVNHRIQHVMLSQTERTLAYSIDLGNGVLVDLAYWINDYVEHFEHHLNQILDDQYP